MKPYICNHCLRIHDAELGECLEAHIAKLKSEADRDKLRVSDRETGEPDRKVPHLGRD